MAERGEIDARLRTLEDIEAIKQLKYRYLRCLDTKRWDELAETLTEDATTSYADGQYSFRGRDEILRFLKESPLAEEGGFVGVHHCHHPEIEFTGEGRARGTWALYNYLVHKTQGIEMRLGAYYHDEYVKENGRWKIRSTGYTKIFEEFWERADLPSLKLNTD